MKIADMRDLVKDRRVREEINRHLWIESQKAGHSIGLERATDEWLEHYALSWLKYHEPAQYQKVMGHKNGKPKKKRS